MGTIFGRYKVSNTLNMHRENLTPPEIWGSEVFTKNVLIWVDYIVGINDR